MLFLVLIKFTSTDKECSPLQTCIDISTEFLKTSKYLYKKYSENEDNDCVYVNFTEKIFKNVLILMKETQDKLIFDENELLEILELFYKLEFMSLKRIKTFFEGLLDELYRKYGNTGIPEFLTNNKLVRKFLENLLIFSGVKDGFNTKFDFVKIIFLIRNIPELKLKILLNLDNIDFKRFTKDIIFVANYVRGVKMKLIKMQLLKPGLFQNKMINNVKNLSINYQDSWGNIKQLEVFKNLKHLEIFLNSSEEKYLVPNLKTLESLRIEYKNIKLKFEFSENLKCLTIFQNDRIDDFNFSDIEKSFPNLEYFFIYKRIFNYKKNIEILRKYCKKLKKLRNIYVFIEKVDNFSYKPKKSKGKNQKIVILPTSFQISAIYGMLFYSHNESNDYFFRGKRIDLEKCNENEIKTSFSDCIDCLCFIRSIPSNIYLERICDNGYFSKLYLGVLNISNETARNLGKLKYVSTLVFKLVKFEDESFSILIEALKYNIKDIDFFRIILSKTEIIELKKIKSLKSINGPYEVFPRFENYYIKINKNEFTELYELSLYYNNLRDENEKTYNTVEKMGFGMYFLEGLIHLGEFCVLILQILGSCAN